MFEALARPPATVQVRSMVSGRPLSRESLAGRPGPWVTPAAPTRISAPASIPRGDEAAETT
jgi:hypothetical protein